MKKFGVFSILTLGLILVAGCTLTQNQEWSSDVMAVYNQSNAMTCNITYTAEWEEWTAVLYVKDGMIREDTTATVDWEEYSISTLAKDGKMYMWWDIYEDNAGFTFDYDLDMNEELSSFTELDEWTTISCVNGVKKSSVFNVPNNVEFSSMNDWLGDVDMEWDDTLWETEIELQVEENWDATIVETNNEQDAAEAEIQEVAEWE